MADGLSIDAGDVAGLAPAELARRRDITALAAVASATQRVEDLRLLAGCTGDAPAAFVWLWRLLEASTNAQAWDALDAIPDPATVPVELQPDVRRFLTTDPRPADQRKQPTPRLIGAQRLLGKLASADPFARDVAREILSGSARADLQIAAARIAGAEGSAYRETVLDLADTLASNAERQFDLLAQITAPYEPAEPDRIIAYITARATALQRDAPETQWRAVRVLAARLEPKQVADLLRGPLSTPTDKRAALTTVDFVQMLGAAKVRGLLEEEPDLAPLLCDHFEHLGDPAAGDVGEWAHAHLDPATLQPWRQRLLRDAQGGYSDTARRRALALLQRFALVPPAREYIGRRNATVEYAAALRPGEVLGIAAISTMPEDSRGPLGQLGRVLGRLLERADSDDALAEPFINDVRAVLHALSDQRRACVLGDLAAHRHAHRLPDVIVDLVIEGPRATRRLIEEEHADEVVAAVLSGRGGEPLLVLELEHGELTADQRDELVAAVDWAAADEAGDFSRIIGALVKHPTTLAACACDAVRGLGRHPAPSSARVTTLVAAALDADAVGGNDTDLPLIRTLMAQPDLLLHQTAARWLATGPPTADRVGLAVEGDRDHAHPDNPYAAARRTLAAQLADRAADSTRDPDDRAGDLTLAAEADGATARPVAFAVLAGAPTPLRRAAAAVLTLADGVAEDEALLQQLIDSELDNTTRDHLRAALRRLASPSAAEALENLLTTVGSADRYGPLDIAICLPHAQWHDTFRQEVDELRRSFGGQATDQINNMVTLGELLAEQAVASAWGTSSDTKKRDQAQKILANVVGKPDTGDLVNRQQVQIDFPWIRHYASLRELRTGHPAPRGSTTPRVIEDSDATTASGLLRHTVEGWIGQMYSAARRKPPPPR